MNRLKESHVSRIGTSITFFAHPSNYYFATEDEKAIFVVTSFQMKVKIFCICFLHLECSSEILRLPLREVMLYPTAMAPQAFSLISFHFFMIYSLLSAPKCVWDTLTIISFSCNVQKMGER